MNLYEVLGVPKDATSVAIKQAYYKLALQYHPDRHAHSGEEEREAAALKFKEIGLAYECLSDVDRRAFYDATGKYDQESGDFDWKDLFKRVTMADLNAFQAQYQGSQEERDDIIRLWQESKGSMEAVVDGLFFGEDEQIDRYLRVIREASHADNLICPDDRVAAVLKRRRQKWRQREAKEAAEMADKLGLNDLNLGQLIKGRAKDRFDSMITNLESKYASKSKKKTGKSKKQ